MALMVFWAVCIIDFLWGVQERFWWNQMAKYLNCLTWSMYFWERQYLYIRDWLLWGALGQTGQGWDYQSIQMNGGRDKVIWLAERHIWSCRVHRFFLLWKQVTQITRGCGGSFSIWTDLPGRPERVLHVCSSASFPEEWALPGLPVLLIAWGCCDFSFCLGPSVLPAFAVWAWLCLRHVF